MKSTLNVLLTLIVLQCIQGCTVTANGETKTYSVADILDKVEQTISGQKSQPEDSNYDSQQGDQPLLQNKATEQLPYGQALNWERFLYAQMQLDPSFDYSEHADSYMRIFRSNLWQRYRHDEFELASKRQETISIMKGYADSFNPGDLFLIQTSFEFGSYDFNRELFPLDSVSESSFFPYRRTASFTLPGLYKLGFTNPSIIGDLYMDENEAKAFLQKRKHQARYVNRKVYAKIFFSNLRLENSKDTFTADLQNVYVYSDPDYRLPLATYSKN